MQRNRAYNQSVGIYSYNANSLVEDNDAWNNTIGIQTGYQGWIIGNRSFDNGTGISTYYSSNISRNQVYSNSTGIRTSCVSVARYASPNRRASAPNFSTTSSGSTPFPFDFDIVSP